MSTAPPWYAQEMRVFYALSLLQPTASRMRQISNTVADIMDELDPESAATNADWREHVITPMYRDVILPGLNSALNVTFRQQNLTSRSPVAAVTYDGHDLLAPGPVRETFLHELSQWGYEVEVSAEYLALVLLGAESIQTIAGLPLNFITLGFQAGLTATELRNHHLDGTLDMSTLTLMAGLRS